MNLSSYLKKHDVSVPAFRAKLVKAGLLCSVSGVRKWAAGERIPGRDAMPVIKKVTRGKVAADDFFAKDRSA